MEDLLGLVLRRGQLGGGRGPVLLLLLVGSEVIIERLACEALLTHNLHVVADVLTNAYDRVKLVTVSVADLEVGQALRDGARFDVDLLLACLY